MMAKVRRRWFLGRRHKGFQMGGQARQASAAGSGGCAAPVERGGAGALLAILPSGFGAEAARETRAWRLGFIIRTSEERCSAPAICGGREARVIKQRRSSTFRGELHLPRQVAFQTCFGHHERTRQRPGQVTDRIIADIGLAEWGRKEIKHR